MEKSLGYDILHTICLSLQFQEVVKLKVGLGVEILYGGHNGFVVVEIL